MINLVYVIQDPQRINILPATKFGELHILLESTRQITYSPGVIINKLMRDLSKFSDNDYLLLIGDPVAIGIVTAIAAHWNRGKVRMLKWDRQEKQYYPVEMNLYPKGSEDDNRLE